MYELIEQEVSTQPRYAIRAMCRALSVSRADYYRSEPGAELVEEDLNLRDVMQEIALAMPPYGYRRITAELRRRGWLVNHKRVHRLLREDNLLCLRQRGFLHTTDSNHGWKVYPNLVPDLALNGVNQLWVADITYIRLIEEFVYLAVILDAFSRRCIGWALEPTLEAELALSALRRALGRRLIRPGIVHHSDRGVQYACGAYTEVLEQNGFCISMSRRGNPYNNAQAESFIKTLKWEEVYRSEYRNCGEARSQIGEFIEQVYNEKRLHSALGYLPPAEFESNLVVHA